MGVAPVQVTPHALAPQVAVPLPAPGPAQAPHAPPAAPLPQTETDCAVVTHPPVLLQHPVGQEVALQAIQAPAWQIVWLPQVCPSRTFVGVAHTGPAAHDCVPVWHTLPSGLHWVPAEHATHAPLPSHTPLSAPTEQAVPGATAVPWSVQVAVVLVHAVTLPTWQGLDEGEQLAPTRQLAQTPDVQ
ncbi:MAG: hypothetical protein ABUS79_24265 [Pseudomonadota bacterium]